ncbi:MAG: ATP-binding protein [Bacillota bacterium]|nr:ATP-binding protein [Bacillota bacterium]
MILGLRTKLSLSYILVVLTSIFLISVLTNIFLDNQFREYVKKNQEQKNREVVSAISQQMSIDGAWNMGVIENIGVNALENGLIIKVRNSSGKVIWDASVHNNGMCQRIIEHMSHNLNSRYPYMKGSYIERPYDIKRDGNSIGAVVIGSYGPFNLSDNDLTFINALNKIFIGVGIFSLFFALIIGSQMARILISPISRVIDAAKSISRGYFTDRIHEKSSTSEICQLTETINGLADNLEKQELLRKRMTADVAHEFRTPLATLQSHMEAMIDGIWKPDTERIKSCHEEIVRISKMVGDLEKLAKVEGENLILNRSNFNVSELCESIARNFESEYKAKGLEIKLDLEEQYIEADRDKICQVIINLLSNALKYTQTGGLVQIGIRGDEAIAKITIRDNGLGIPEEDLPYIFERFYRADKSRNRLSGGSGIGLTIAKAIVEAHKGKIEVNSKVSEGTEFIVTIPKIFIKGLLETSSR